MDVSYNVRGPQSDIGPSLTRSHATASSTPGLDSVGLLLATAVLQVAKRGVSRLSEKDVFRSGTDT